jgi:cytosine/adenosine deaminase-related metal-dependent hydrolase|tara:strand:+ start:334 stop:510 length:177 start_codon:yes stop_codon:yes gene_type:complete
MQSDCPEYTTEQNKLIQQHLDEKDDEYARLIQDEPDEESEITIQQQKVNLKKEQILLR